MKKKATIVYQVRMKGYTGTQDFEYLDLAIGNANLRNDFHNKKLSYVVKLVTREHQVWPKRREKR